MSTNLIRIGIVEDHSLFRRTLNNYLSQQPNLSVVLQASDIEDLLSKFDAIDLDVLIMDVFLPKAVIPETIKQVRNAKPDASILAMSMVSDVGLVSYLLEAGIRGFVSKADEPEALLEAIGTLAAKDTYRNQIFTEALYINNQRKFMEANSDREISLTDREKRILQLLWLEKSNREIADELFLGVRSVEKIRQELKEKIGAKSIVGMVKYGIDRNIIYPIAKIAGAFKPELVAKWPYDR